MLPKPEEETALIATGRSDILDVQDPESTSRL